MSLYIIVYKSQKLFSSPGPTTLNTIFNFSESSKHFYRLLMWQGKSASTYIFVAMILYFWYSNGNDTIRPFCSIFCQKMLWLIKKINLKSISRELLIYIWCFLTTRKRLHCTYMLGNNIYTFKYRVFSIKSSQISFCGWVGFFSSNCANIAV